jgi:hypothetical protein
MPQDVAERIDDGGSHESWPALRHSLELHRSQRYQPFQRRLHVVDVPVSKRAARLGREARRGESPVDDAQLVLVVADAKLDVPGPRAAASLLKYGSTPRRSVYLSRTVRSSGCGR